MANIEINTLSPVHVGSGRFLMSKLEYVFSPEKIGIVDERKTMELIGEDKMASWVSSIEKGESLTIFLKGFGIKPTLQQLSGRQLTIACDKTRAQGLSTLKEQIHNGKGLPYIPGSSIKGAIRSAIYNQLMRSSSRPVSDFNLKRNNRDYSGSKLESEMFGSDPNHDVFRFLRIGDAYFEPNSTIAMIMDNLNLRGNAQHPDASFDTSKNQLVEAIAPKKKAGFSLQLDQQGIKTVKTNGYINHFPECFDSIQKLFGLINRNTKKLLEEEKSIWSEFDSDPADEYIARIEKLLEMTEKCQEGECILRLSHGSGWRFITGDWIYDDHLVSNDSYQGIIDQARPRNDRYRDFIFPKSRRISSETELPGFVRLSIAKDE